MKVLSSAMSLYLEKGVRVSYLTSSHVQYSKYASGLYIYKRCAYVFYGVFF